MADVRRNGDSLKKSHFARLHERIQTKYEEMQKKIQKSKSVDSLSSLKEDYVYNEPRYASSADINRIDMMNNDTPPEKQSVKYSVIEEEIHKNDATFQYVVVRESSISESEVTPSPFEPKENESDTNRFFGDDFNRLSLESLNEVARESDEYVTPAPTPPPIISIRNKIGTRIKDFTAEKRKQKEKDKAENEKKEKSREKVEKFILSNTKQDKVKTLKKTTKVATVSIALIEATGLETDILEEKTRLLFCRFRLGSEKYKSKVIKSNTSKAKWQELFNFNLYDDNIVEVSLWEKDYCIGRTNIDLSEMAKEKTHKMPLKLDGEVKTTLFILLTITGFSLISLDDYQETQRRLDSVAKKSPWYTYKDESGEVGMLTVIVYGAKGLSANECYCVLELDNERLQTQTEFKTQDPNWMKIFTFEVTDITSILEIAIHDEKKSEDVGCLSLPLLNIKNGEKKWYALKDSSLRDRAKGNNPRILLEMNLTWKLVKASVRVVNPKEHKYLEAKQKLDRHTFSRNLARAKVVFNWTMDSFRVMKSCFEWESRQANVIALTTWLLFCWFFKIWMLPLLILIPFFWYRPPKYFLVRWKDYLFKGPPIEDDSKKEKAKKNQSLRQKINSLTEMVQSVQNFIGAFANLGESIKNLFNFTVPFLSLLAIFIILVIAFVMFMIPTKYIFMTWGIHKFTRKILRPNRVPNNEILDLLSRVPNDEILLNCEEIPLEDVPEEDVIN
ncbi:hypothetical protein PYW07_013711 [Mythimna separata]|uniref:C2 domain-containing protein n=1 Tax=Mythimna separata TaxID=271217 RepID=A0AAD7YEN4_MYTSE|nr:hypothetical protein PYW07_013711 [Mythimna separata]